MPAFLLTLISISSKIKTGEGDGPAPEGCARVHSGVMPLFEVHPAQETNQNAGALFVSDKKYREKNRSM